MGSATCPLSVWWGLHAAGPSARDGRCTQAAPCPVLRGADTSPTPALTFSGLGDATSRDGRAQVPSRVPEQGHCSGGSTGRADISVARRKHWKGSGSGTECAARLPPLPLLGGLWTHRPSGRRCCPERRAPFARPLPAHDELRSRQAWPRSTPSTRCFLPPPTRPPPTARLAYSHVNDNKEVFDIRAWATGHLQEHVPRLPQTLRTVGASQGRRPWI